MGEVDVLPDPLVGAEVDLRGMTWMPYYGDHLSRSEMNAQVSDAGYRAAHNLWWAAWNNVPAASLPNDEVALTRFADLGRDVRQFKKIRGEALHGFVLCSDGRLYHRFMAPLALDAWDRRSKQRDRKRAWRSGIEVTQAEWEKLRKVIFERDHHACKICGDTENLNCDHVIPVSKGGKSVAENLQTLCAACNKRKLNRVFGRNGDVPGTDEDGERGRVRSVLSSGTDERTGKDRTGKQEDSDAVASGADAPADPVKELFDRGVAILGDRGRSLLGKMRQQHGDVAVVEAIVACEDEHPSDPAAFFVRCLQRAPPRGGGHQASPATNLFEGAHRAAEAYIARHQTDFSADCPADEPLLDGGGPGGYPPSAARRLARGSG